VVSIVSARRFDLLCIKIGTLSWSNDKGQSVDKVHALAVLNNGREGTCSKDDREELQGAKELVRTGRRKSRSCSWYCHCVMRRFMS
jgi:hypothetical protein